MAGKSLYKRTLLKLSLAKRTPVEKVAMGRSVFNYMSGSPYFSGQSAILTELANATDLLEDACVEALNDGIKEKQNLVLYESGWHLVMTRVGFIVQNIADENYMLSAIVITSAGLNVRNGRARLPVPLPTYVDARFYNSPGTVKLLIRGGRYARLFSIYTSDNLDDPQSWKLVGSTIKRQYIVTGLKSATRYFFKVIPLGRAGEGTFATIASMLAA